MSVKVRERKKGEWWVFIDHGGTRKAKKIGPRQEAERIAAIIAGRLASGDLGILEDKDRAKTFSFYCRQWLTEIMPTECKASTCKDYQSIHKKHLTLAPFYDQAVDAITENDVELT